MSKLGPRTFGHSEELIFLGREMHESRDYSEQSALEIDQEMNRFLTTARQQAETLLTHYREAMEKVAQALLEKETLEQDDFLALVGPRPVIA